MHTGMRCELNPIPYHTQQVVSVIVAHDLRSGEFVAQVPFFPPLQSPADFSPQRCLALLTAAAGPGAAASPRPAAAAAGPAAAASLRPAAAAAGPRGAGASGSTAAAGGDPRSPDRSPPPPLASDARFEVAEVRPWVMSAQVAERYSAAGGRVLLAGDAAHRFPPAGGFGMNTGIQVWHDACCSSGVPALLGPAALCVQWRSSRHNH